MVNTRKHVTANNAKNNGESNNQEANPLPPPSLTLEQVLAMQAQMLQTMQQTLVNLHTQPKRHCRRGIIWEIFSALSHQPFLMLWS
jgi:hypothetical protein